MYIEAIDDESAPSEDMSGLNNGDIKRIDARIAASAALLQDKIAAEVAGLRPRGWKKALHLLREWSVLGVTATIIVALLALALTQWNAANGRVAEEASFRARTEDRLTAIETSLLTIRVKAVISNPPDSGNQAEAKNLLAVAKKDSVHLPAPFIEQGGVKFIDAAERDSNAWKVALDFISYRTVLNFREMPTGKLGPLPPGRVWRYDLPHSEQNKPVMQFTGQVGVPAKEAARLEVIGNDLNRDLPEGPALITITGGVATLDSHYIRQVVFRQVEIHYSGQPVILEDVVFIDCKFIFDNDDNGRDFGRVLLANARVTFRAKTS